LLKISKVGRVALASYTLAAKLAVSAIKSTATSCRIQVVADLLPKLAAKSTVSATKPTVSATVDFVADLLPVSAAVRLCRQCVPGFKAGSKQAHCLIH